jgi:hypothetical protein
MQEKSSGKSQGDGKAMVLSRRLVHAEKYERDQQSTNRLLIRILFGEPIPFPPTSSPQFVDGIAAPEVRKWPTFRAFPLSPFRPGPS